VEKGLRGTGRSLVKGILSEKARRLKAMKEYHIFLINEGLYQKI
jgi:hypothetical protein